MPRKPRRAWKPEAFTPFNARGHPHASKFDEKTAGRGLVVMHTAESLNVGETSMLIPTGKGGVLVHLDQREPIDEAKFKAEKPHMVEQVAQICASGILFQEWIEAPPRRRPKHHGTA